MTVFKSVSRRTREPPWFSWRLRGQIAIKACGWGPPVYVDGPFDGILNRLSRSTLAQLVRGPTSAVAIRSTRNGPCLIWPVQVIPYSIDRCRDANMLRLSLSPISV